MHKSFLILSAMKWVLWKAVCSETGPYRLRRGQRKRSERNLVGALLHSFCRATCYRITQVACITHRTASATDWRNKQVTYDMDQRMAHARISVHNCREKGNKPLPELHITVSVSGSDHGADQQSKQCPCAQEEQEGDSPYRVYAPCNVAKTPPIKLTIPPRNPSTSPSTMPYAGNAL